MSSIRRQSIISSIVIYTGFCIGLLNIYLFTKQGLFEEAHFGLYNAFIAISLMISALANMAMPSYIYKFYPYYADHLPTKKNDQATIALIIGIIGFIIVLITGLLMKELVLKKYGTNAPELVTYYKWIFPLGLGLTIYSILEAYAWQLHKSVLTNFLKEIGWRLFTTVLIVLFATGIINNFDLFIKLFSLSFPFIALVLLLYLIFTKQIHFTFNISKVSRRYFKSILRLCSFVYTGSLIFTLSTVFDSLLISSVLDRALMQLAVYSLAQNIASMIQAPQRALIAASIAHLSRAWKDKNMSRIQHIYQRSSINQLIFACGLFGLIILSFTDAVTTFKLKGIYLEGYYVVVFLGLSKIIDMGTGLNAQIIGTSIHWKFEMLSGVVLLLIMMPLSYFFTKEMGITGTALANLVSITIYNAIRIGFLWKKFRLFPFTIQSIYAVLLAGASFTICYFTFRDLHGLGPMIIRSISFVLLFAAGVIYMKLTPDMAPVIDTLKKKTGLKK